MPLKHLYTAAALIGLLAGRSGSVAAADIARYTSTAKRMGEILATSGNEIPPAQARQSGGRS